MFPAVKTRFYIFVLFLQHVISEPEATSHKTIEKVVQEQQETEAFKVLEKVNAEHTSLVRTS